MRRASRLFQRALAHFGTRRALVVALVHTNRCRHASLQETARNKRMASFASPLQPLSNGATSIAADEELLYTLEDVRITAAPQEGDNTPWGAGRLRVTSRRVLWEQPLHASFIVHERKECPA